MNSFPGLRSRVWLLAALFALLTFVHALLVYSDQRRHAMARGRAEIQFILASILAEEQHQSRRMQELLPILLGAGKRTEAGCSRIANSLLQNQSDYQNMGIVRSDGTLLCSATPMDTATFSEAAWFKEAMGQEKVSQNSYFLDSSGERPSIIISHSAQPRASGQIEAIAFAHIELSQLVSPLFKNRPLPGWESAILASDGRVLFSLASGDSRVSFAWSDEKLNSMLREHGSTQIEEIVGGDGTAYLVGIATLGSTGDRGYIGVALEKSTVLDSAHRSFLKYVFFLILGSVALVWLLRRVWVSRQRKGEVSVSERELQEAEVITQESKAPVDQSDGGEHGVIQEKLRQRTEELTALLEIAPAYIWIARDPEGREIYANPPANELAFGSVQTDQNADVHELSNPSSQAVESPLQRAISEKRAVLNIEMEALCPDGGPLLLSGNAIPLFNAQGTIRGAVGIFVDRLAQQTTERALRLSEQLLNVAGRMANLASWSIDLQGSADLEGSPIHWSDEMFRILGYRPGEVAPSLDLFSKHLSPDEASGLMADLSSVLVEKKAHSREYSLVRRDGLSRQVLEYVDCQKDATGRVTYCYGLVQDVTDYKQLDSEIVKHREHLEVLVAERTYEYAMGREIAERANRAKSKFLADVSHDLRTPMNSLVLLARVLANNGSDNLMPQQREYLRVIESTGTDLLHQIDDLLDLGRIESGRARVRVECIPFPDIMQSVRRLHRHVAKLKGLDFRMEIEADVPATIVTDCQRLQQLLRNLLSNAIEFTDKGSVTLRIRQATSGWRCSTTTLAKAETVVALDIVDTGSGIKPGLQREIYEMFGRGSLEMDEESTSIGMGLTLAHNITLLLGGELDFSSVLGQGSIFTIYLPLIYVGPTCPRLEIALSKPSLAQMAPETWTDVSI